MARPHESEKRNPRAGADRSQSSTVLEVGPVSKLPEPVPYDIKNVAPPVVRMFRAEVDLEQASRELEIDEMIRAHAEKVDGMLSGLAVALKVSRPLRLFWSRERGVYRALKRQPGVLEIIAERIAQDLDRMILGDFTEHA